MARPIKEGLDYFPMDTDIEQNDKIALLEVTYGSIAIAVILKILAKIYSVGYYYKWGEKEELLLKRKIYQSDINLEEFMNDCLKFDLFNEYMYRKYSILTSIDIQATYFEALKRRKTLKVIAEYILLDEETINSYTNISSSSINVNNNDLIDGINENINTQSKEDNNKANIKEDNNKIDNQLQDESIIDKNSNITNNEANISKNIDLIINYYLNNIKNSKNYNDEDLISINKVYKKYEDVDFIMKVMESALKDNITKKGKNTIKSFNYFIPILENKWDVLTKIQEAVYYDEFGSINSKTDDIETERFVYGG